MRVSNGLMLQNLLTKFPMLKKNKGRDSSGVSSSIYFWSELSPPKEGLNCDKLFFEVPCICMVFAYSVFSLASFWSMSFIEITKA